jgi:hypothetical protein
MRGSWDVAGVCRVGRFAGSCIHCSLVQSLITFLLKDNGGYESAAKRP